MAIVVGIQAVPAFAQSDDTVVEAKLINSDFTVVKGEFEEGNGKSSLSSTDIAPNGYALAVSDFGGAYQENFTVEFDMTTPQRGGVYRPSRRKCGLLFPSDRSQRPLLRHVCPSGAREDHHCK